MLLSLKSDQIMEGMVLDQDIVGSKGNLILASGETLTGFDIMNLSYLFREEEILLKEPRLDRSVSLTPDVIRKGVLSSINQENDLETMYVMLTILKESIGGYFSKVYPQLIDLRKADPATFQHSLNVGWYSLILGQALRLSEEESLLLLQASVLHDIGKTYIPKTILRKESKLTEEEFKVVKKHSEYGESWSKQFTCSRVSQMIRHHHEHLDGKGYPDGLTARDIDRLTHIITVADIFDALTSKRAYRTSMPVHKAFSIMNQEVERGKISGEYVDLFKQSIGGMIH